MPSYDRSLSPPGPVASVRLSHPVTGIESGLLAGKLDTGADIAVIPESVPAQLGLSAWGRTRATAFDGSVSTRPVYYVDMLVEGVHLSGVRCVASRRNSVLLGRNVLNCFLITLNGKELTFDLQDP